MEAPVTLDRSRRLAPDLWMAAGIALAAFAGGLWIIARFPLFEGTDAYIRLAHRDQILLLRWLPLLQAFLVGIGKVSSSLTFLRGALAAVSALAMGAGYLLACRVFDRTTAIAFVVWLSTSALVIELGTIAYQELLFLLLLLLALFLLHRSDEALGADPRMARRLRWLAAAVTNLACLTRYEGWLLVGIVTLEALVGALAGRGSDGFPAEATASRVGPSAGGPSAGGASAGGLSMGGRSTGGRSISARSKAALRRSVATFLTFGGLPIVLWLLFGPGLSAAGEPTTWRAGAAALFASLVDYARLLHRQAGAPVLLLAIVGVLWTLRSERSPTHRRIAGFLILTVSMVVVMEPYGYGPVRAAARRAAAAGEPAALVGDPRQSFYVLAFLLMYAAAGARRLVTALVTRMSALPRSAGRALGMLVLGLIVAFGAQRSATEGLRALHRNARRPKIVVSHLTSRWILDQAHPDARIFVQRTPDRPAVFRLATYTGMPLDRFTRYAGETRDPRLFDALPDRLAAGRPVYVCDAAPGSRERLVEIRDWVLGLRSMPRLGVTLEEVGQGRGAGHVLALVPEPGAPVDEDPQRR